MKTFFLLSVLIARLSISSNAQNLITVQNGTNVSFYTTITAAVSAAINGDTIYIPGGHWNLGGTISINKTLHILGVGHDPDSDTSSQTTTLSNGVISLSPGSSNGSISGIKLDQGIVYNNQYDSISNYYITRNHMQSLSLSNNFSGIISENIINASITTPNYNNSINGFFNNIIGGQMYKFGPGNIFRNNIFLRFEYAGLYQIHDCLFENNIFFVNVQYNLSNAGIQFSIFNNNLFVENFSFPLGLGNDGLNNLFNQPQSSIFVNQTGINFNYSYDYHLQTSSPGKSAGTDGTDIGIYGGTFPWKDGSLPQNPHIQFKQIAGATDQNGNLKINIKVKAQNN
ncbi:MAG: hypothetical protein IPL31_00210 [Saprospiraceae bacterium]|nr:hypothetical protein [Saprospiraceae bacterium]